MGILRARLRTLGAAALIGFTAALIFATIDARAEEPSVDRYSLPAYDISWPQCPGPTYPSGPVGFAIVGVTGGRPFTANRCLKEQNAWASSFDHEAVYINLDRAADVSVFGASGPAGNCAADDTWCQLYNYGFNAARHAHMLAWSKGVTTDTYWLDVETMNRWSNIKHENARVIGGAIEYFQQRNIKVGIYSTPYQWGEIAGNYAPRLPVWTAGASSAAEAPNRCNARYAFGGGEVHMVQWVEQFDMNYVCPVGRQP